MGDPERTPPPEQPEYEDVPERSQEVPPAEGEQGDQDADNEDGQATAA